MKSILIAATIVLVTLILSTAYVLGIYFTPAVSSAPQEEIGCSTDFECSGHGGYELPEVTVDCLDCLRS